MTFTTSRLLPVIGLLAGIALLTPAPPATAATPATPATSTAGAVGGVTITSDSVVATARVSYNGDPLSVFVSWGDGTSSPGTLGTPSGSVLVLSHTYTPPANGAAFTKTMTVTTNTGAVDRTVLITPRYAVTQSEQLFSPLTFCDSLVETETEWHVYEVVYQGRAYDGPEISSQEWTFDLHSGNDEPLPPAFYRLLGSSKYYEMTMADPKLLVQYNIAEVDPLIDDWLSHFAFELHPSRGSYDASRIFVQFSGDCEVELDSDVTVTLLTPQPPPEPVGVPRMPPPSPPPTSPPTPPPCQGNPQNCQEP